MTHSAILTRSQTERFGRPIATQGSDPFSSLGDESAVWKQFQLELAFPDMSAVEQIAALLVSRFGERLSLALIRRIKPLNEDSFHYQLDLAISSADDEAQYIVLLFSPFKGKQLSQATLSHLPSLLASDSPVVRAYALRMVAHSGDERALLQAAKELLGPEGSKAEDNKVWSWYASEVVLEATSRGLVDLEPAASRMQNQHLGVLVRRIGVPISSFFGKVVDALIRRSLDLEIAPHSLEIEVRQQPGTDLEQHYFSLSESQRAPHSPGEGMQRAFETAEAFRERQRNLHLAFDALLASLTRVNASELLDQFGLEDFDPIVIAEPELSEEWVTLLLATYGETRLGWVRNIALLIARSVSKYDAHRSVELFEKFETVRPTLRQTFGLHSIDLSTMAVWSASDQPELIDLRKRRLDQASNNDQIAQEAWAAVWYGKSEQLFDYIESRLVSNWPAAQARGILVAGLMGKNPRSDEVLKAFENTPGLLGDTQKVAMTIYQRRIWADYWLSLMRSATTKVSFWRASVLYAEIADGRFLSSQAMEEPATEFFDLYWPDVQRQLRSAAEKKQGKLKKNLLSAEAPDPVFL